MKKHIDEKEFKERWGLGRTGKDYRADPRSWRGFPHSVDSEDPEGASLILWMVDEAAEALLFLLFLVMFSGMDYSWVYNYG